MHPRQASVLHDVFTPTAEAIARVRAIVAAAPDSGGAMLRAKVIMAPVGRVASWPTNRYQQYIHRTGPLATV